MRCWRNLLQTQGMSRTGPDIPKWLELSSALMLGSWFLQKGADSISADLAGTWIEGFGVVHGDLCAWGRCCSSDSGAQVLGSFCPWEVGIAEQLELGVCCSHNFFFLFNLSSSVSCCPAGELSTCLFPPQKELPAARPAGFLCLTTTGLLFCVSSPASGAGSVGMG